MFRSIRRGAVALTVGMVSAVMAPAIASAETTSDPTVSAQIRQGAGDFVPLPPARIVDTRFGIGAPVGKVPAVVGNLGVQVTGNGGVPAGATGVFINFTVTEPDFEGGGGTLSSQFDFNTESFAEMVVFKTGQTVSNMGFAALGSDGRFVALLSSITLSGNAHIVIDVMGYVAPSAGADASRMVSVSPSRILDTREANGLPAALGPGKTVAANGTGTLQVKGRGGVPSNATAVMLNLTGVSPTANTYVTAYPGDQATPPNASNLNLVPGQIKPNVVVVKLPADGTVKLFNYDGNTHLVADVIGYFVPAAGVSGNTGKIVPQDPRLQMVTEDNPFILLGPGETFADEFTSYLTVADGQPAAGLFMSVYAESDAAGYLTVFPGGAARPLASNLNLVPDVATVNLVPVATGPGATVSFYNFAGNTIYAVSIVGYVLP